ncbi:MAG: AMP-binding protein [Aeromicrobium sp.]
MTSTPEIERLVRAPFGDLRCHGTRPALLTDDSVLTFEQLADRVDQMVEVLGGARRLVLLRGGNTIDTVVAYLAALTAGHPVILTREARPGRPDPWMTAHDPDIVIDTAGDRGVDGLGVDVRRATSAYDLHPDLALLLTTSGSTGSPRLVRLSHTNVTSNAAAIASYLDLDGTDRGVLNLPLHYCYGLSVLNSHLAVGAGVVVTSRSVVDTCFWDLVDRHGVTGLAGVPHTFDLLDASGFADRELDRLRYVTQAGGKLAPERVTQYLQLGQRRGWDFVVMYGQTEATARIAYLAPDLAERHPSAIGVAIPGGRLRLDPVGDPGEDDADPAIGEIVYSGPNVMMGYASTTADLARGAELTELRTGDLGRALPDGLFEVVGRSSRFAKVFGLRLDLDQMERHLKAAGMPAACAEVDGSLVVVVERRRHAARARDAVADLCDLPRWVIHAVRADIPTTASGKTDHRAVASLAAGVIHDSSGNSCGAGVDDLCELYAGLLGRDHVTADDSFVGLGADSLSYVELSVRLGERIDRLPRDWHLRTISELSPTSANASRRGTSVDPSVLLRALAIVLIVATHANLLTVLGAAHALLAVAGYNAARFLPRRGRAARQLARTAWRTALPSCLWIGSLVVLTSDYETATAFMANGFVGSDSWTLEWRFWFLEAIVWTLLGVAVVLAVPAARRLERRAPFACALGLVAVAACLRFALVGVGAGPTERYTGTIVLWCFALGWAAARAHTAVQRGVVTALAILLTFGFFGDAWREAVVVAGIAVLLWVPALRLPAKVATACGALAAASLSIYLTHWQVYPHLEMEYPLLATVSSLVVGLAYHRLSTPVLDAIERAVSRGRAALTSQRAGRWYRPGTAVDHSWTASAVSSSRGYRSTSMAALIAAPMSTEIEST